MICMIFVFLREEDRGEDFVELMNILVRISLFDVGFSKMRDMKVLSVFKI